ncbi:hypothetical protein PAECIP111802_06755 [Paenibacillus allorhizosphaerae]|uniref:Uncharacterized protein n=1 Tax=Paenibacillus allorhizosphaerae TaxID=2849866 RepID=A0ABN7TWF5_9BACL|nr:hypothetical protein PAECIP111802_06755 [Paenibacillus allorhizosphaerae]
MLRKDITNRLVITNCSREVYFTDIMLQAGTIATGWVGHVCEIKWTAGWMILVDLFIEKQYIIFGSISQSVRVRYLLLG